jgi:hypothetical protein
MTIKSLRETLSNLSSDFDDREVWFCVRFEEDGNRVVSFDEPVIGSMIPDSTDTFLLLSEKAMEYMVEKNPNIEDSSGNNWVKGTL